MSTTDNARPHYYTFQHRYLPTTAHQYGVMFCYAMLTMEGELERVWKKVGDSLKEQVPRLPKPPIEVKAYRTESYVFFHFAFPEAERVTESPLIIVVIGPAEANDQPFWNRLEKAPVGVYLLELGHNPVTDQPYLVACTWGADGMHANFGSGPQPSQFMHWIAEKKGIALAGLREIIFSPKKQTP